MDGNCRYRDSAIVLFYFKGYGTPNTVTAEHDNAKGKPGRAANQRGASEGKLEPSARARRLQEMKRPQ